MNVYQNTVNLLTLSQITKEKICNNLQAKLSKGVRSSALPTLSIRAKRLLATALSFVLFVAVAFPSVWYGFGFAEGENWVAFDDGGGSGAPSEYNPDGVHAKLIGGHKLYYKNGECFTLSCKVSSGHEIADISYKTDGFAVISIDLVSTSTTEMGLFVEKDGEYIPWTEWTYEVKLQAFTKQGKENSCERETSFEITFLTDNDYTPTLGMYGYSTDRRIYMSRFSGGSAFYKYIYFLRDHHRISSHEFSRMMREYDLQFVIEEDYIIPADK